MRITPPSLRRRNGALLDIGSREKWLARRNSDEVHDDKDGDHVEGDDHADQADSSDSDLDSDSDSDSDDEPTATQPSGSAPTGGVGVITIPPTNNGAVVPGVTLGADEGAIDDDSDSDDEENETTTAPPAAGTPSTAVGSPPTAITSSASSTASTSSTSSGPALPRSTSETVPIASATSSISGVSIATQSIAPTTLPTMSPGPSLTVPAAGGAQQSDEPALPDTESPTAVPLQESNAMGGGAAAGIVIGVLAIIGVMIGAAFWWRKYRRGRGLPFLPVALPFWKKRDSNYPYSGDSAFPPPNGNAKTNTKIMDDLMRAAYDSENGGNDMAGAGFYGSNEKQSAWLDEKAFVALGGELTPRRTSKPVNRWLSAIATPRQSRPGFPPSERMSTQSTTRFPIRLSQSPPRGQNVLQEDRGMRPPMPGTMAGDRLEPPKPAYNARETMTTDTTSTSVRWYG